MRCICEALRPQDQIRVFELQQDILDIKIRMVDATDEEKERLKQDIEDIQQQIQDIKDSAE